MNLRVCPEGKEFLVDAVKVEDEELKAFLFSLGCYRGEPITVITRQRSGLIVAIKEARYSIDARLAEAIEVSAD